METCSNKSRYPYIVKMSDELLTVSEIERYRAVAIIRNRKKDNLVALHSFTLLLFMFCTSLFLISGMFATLEPEITWSNQFEFGYAVCAWIAGIIAVISLFVVIKAKIRLDALPWVDEFELDLVDRNPEDCETLARWMSEHADVRAYVEKISELGRLPTYAEFHCIEHLLKERERSIPVENLKQLLWHGVDSHVSTT